MHAVQNAAFPRLLPFQSCAYLVWVRFIHGSLVLFSLAGLLYHVRRPSWGLLLLHHLLRRCSVLVQLLALFQPVPSVGAVLLQSLLDLSRP